MYVEADERSKIHVLAVFLLMSKELKVPCTECNRLNCTHVKRVERNKNACTNCTLIGLFKQNGSAGSYWTPPSFPRNSGCHWRLGTQALHEIYHY